MSRGSKNLSGFAYLPVLAWLFTSFASYESIVENFGLRQDSLRRNPASVVLHLFFHSDNNYRFLSVVQFLAVVDKHGGKEDVLGGLLGATLASLCLLRLTPASLWGRCLSTSPSPVGEAAMVALVGERGALVWRRLLSPIGFLLRRALRLLADVATFPACTSCTLVTSNGRQMVLCGGAGLNAAMSGFRGAYRSLPTLRGGFVRYVTIALVHLLTERREGWLASTMPLLSFTSGALVGYALRLPRRVSFWMGNPHPIEIPVELMEMATVRLSHLRIRTPRRGGLGEQPKSHVPTEAEAEKTVLRFIEEPNGGHGRESTSVDIAKDSKMDEEYEYVTLPVPSSCFCPITCALMSDPVMTDDGFTFEREAITKWLRRSDRCPVTNLELSSKCLQPDFAVRKEVLEVVQGYKMAIKGEEKKLK